VFLCVLSALCASAVFLATLRTWAVRASGGKKVATPFIHISERLASGSELPTPTPTDPIQE